MDDVVFCSGFDAAVARSGVPAVLVADRDGLFKIDEEWLRDAWTRLAAASPDRAPSPGLAWTLLRDHSTGFVSLALITSPDLLVAHPRADVRAYRTRAEAEAARASFGRPPVCREPW